MLTGASLDAEASSTKFSVNSSNHFGRSCDWSPSARLRVLRLRVVAGLGVESSTIESCDTDVEKVLVVELEGPVDNKEQRWARNIQCCIMFSAVFF